jgi:hypothetical protein
VSARKPGDGTTTPPREPEDADVRSQPADFSDPESQRVLGAAARELARELGRQAARELWEQAVRR